MTTEHDAALKICPIQPGGLPHGAGGGGAVARCAGSACMAWRWATAAPDPARFSPKTVSWPFWREEGDITFAEAASRPIPPRPDSVPADWEEALITGDDWENADGGEWREPEAQARARYQVECDKRIGFCGLAGRPEKGTP